MGWARELTEQEDEFCRALGEVVVFWNHVEQSFRVLLQRATFLGGPDGRIWGLIAHLTPVQLKDALIAIAADHEPERAAHLRHCATLFDREREYRNHYVHGPLTFATTELASIGVVESVIARGGSLRVQQALISAAELTTYRDRLGAPPALHWRTAPRLPRLAQRKGACGIGDASRCSPSGRRERELVGLVRPITHSRLMSAIHQISTKSAFPDRVLTPPFTCGSSNGRL
jgi:hypothetical protein